MNQAQLDAYVRNARSSVSSKGMDYTITSEITGVYPFWDAEASEAKPATVQAFEMYNSAEGKRHNVVLGYTGPDEMFIWCGDNFIEGGNTKPPVAERIRMTADELPDMPDAQKLVAELRSRLPKSSGCHFWTAFKRDGSLCKHCNQMLVQKQSELPAILAKLQTDFETRIEGKVAGGSLPPVSSEAIAKIVTKIPVLLEGEHGWGKTREARQFAKSISAPLVMIAGHESVEAADLLGFTVRHGEDWVWKDGRLSQAFRLAAKGGKVVLVIDELRRIPQRQLSVLLTALAPDEGNYYLETGRIVQVEDGIGTEETLVAPVENLYIIGTTNVGAQYAVDDMDPALDDRMVKVRRSRDVSQLRAALKVEVDKKKFPEKVIDECVAFYEAMCKLHAQGYVKGTPNPRTLPRAVLLADTLAEVPVQVETIMLTWVSYDVDGQPSEDQVDAVRKAIKSVWK